MKTSQVLKAILIGALAGAAIFFTPFPFRFFFVFFFIFFAIRFFAFGRWGRRGYWAYKNSGSYSFWNPSYTQRWHNMSEEQRKIFIQKMEKELFTNSEPLSSQQ